jgi:probable HAF family extracellular repeat protein
MKRCIVVGAVLFGFFSYAATLALADDFTFIPINFPGATSTVAHGINNSGQIVGSFTDGSGNHSFVDTGGSFTSFNFPGAISTTAFGINNSGQIVGGFTDGSGNHGFVDTGGSFTSFTFQGGNFSTEAHDINDLSEIVGEFTDASGTHGFLDSAGSFTRIDVPDLVAIGLAGMVTSTRAFGINNRHQIVGEWIVPDACCHGFLLSGGSFTSFNFPGGDNFFTEADGISDNGQIVGTAAFLSEGEPHGFLLDSGALLAEPCPVENPFCFSMITSINVN